MCPCAILLILLTIITDDQDGTGEKKVTRWSACLSAAVVRGRDPCPKLASLPPGPPADSAAAVPSAHIGSAAAQPPAAGVGFGCTAGRQRVGLRLLVWAAGA